MEEDYLSHLEASLEYYISIDNPALGLHWYQQQDKQQESETINKLLLVLIR